ncbi:hypothetical protein ACFS2C_25155 [Prauserella oleivorans]|uniref:Uncharacterized protein n=1 Tax=Prauserella oleivorans TaxID=1478153 RepID=A0ABW5WFB3_9PSEU
MASKNRRPWFVVATAAAGVGGVIAIAGTASADDVSLNDGKAAAQVQQADHGQQADADSAASADSPTDRDDVHTANTPDDSPTDRDDVHTADSPADRDDDRDDVSTVSTANTPDSADSPE